MPIDISLRDGIIYTEFSGEIDFDMATKYIDFIASLKDKIQIRNELHDHTHTTSFKLTADDIFKLASYSKKTRDIFKQINLAVFAPNDFTFGMTRMFQVFYDMEKYPLNARIFKNKDDAITFLKDQIRLYESEEED